MGYNASDVFANVVVLFVWTAFVGAVIFVIVMAEKEKRRPRR